MTAETLAATPAAAGNADDLIGPGRVVLVVGPSGAGKDMLINAARDRLGDDFVFPRRMVTRPPSAAEDNVEASPELFRAVAASGGFALSWEAHGHRYGVPVAIDLAIIEGRTVVCNVSRTVVEAARARYARVTVVEVTAPPEVLASRIANRGRDSDALSGKRADRALVATVQADHVIVNDGPPETAAAAFLAALTDGAA